MEHLKSLNQAQKEAVQTTSGPVLVLAGAGAGKTRTIAHRVVHLVKSGVPGSQILAITFTNKAAKEMRERVVSLLSQHSAQGVGRGPTVSTFHALSAQLLRQYAKEAELPKNFTIFDRTDSLRAVKRAIREAGEDDKRFEPRVVLSTISRAKGDAKTLPLYREETGNAWFQTTVAGIWERYDATLRKEGAVDFDDLLLNTWRLLVKNKEVQDKLQQRWLYLHIDEYQDTNKVQYEIARLLAGERRNIFCVGDLDQNVYSWRGSTTENILEFEKTFPDAKVLRLEQNYRSTQTIVAVSNDIIRKNKNRKEKTLFTDNPEGEKMSLLVGYDEHDEAAHIVAQVQVILKDGVEPNEVAILYRANFQSRVLEDAFLAAGIPHKVLGTRFFDRKEVKDVLTYMRAALNPDNESDIRRIINTPTRGIGKVTVDRLFGEGRTSLTGRAKEKVDVFYGIIENIRARAENKSTSEAFAYALERSGIADSLGGKGEDDEERLENVRELVSLAASRYDSFEAPDGVLRMLEDAALATDQDELDRRNEKSGAVALMTIHAAKGLEFSHVFITGLEDGLFPHERMHTPNSGNVDDEEERRLFYVALTRAKEKVYLSYAQVRTVFGKRTTNMPSEFLIDIDEDFLEADETPAADTGKVVYLD